MANPQLAIVTLGSNLGDSRSLLAEAIQHLQALSDQPLLVSHIIQTEPVDCPPGSPPFLNAAVGLQPRAHETPESLLHALQGIEKAMGRKRSGLRNEPRTVDLDLIVFGSEVRQTPELILPHPRAHLRRFVLEPVAQIVPNLVLPGQVLTVKQLLEVL